MGEVYRAFDRERGLHVALKVLRGTSPMALYRFKQEFRALANTSHPNLLTLYELASFDGTWFFTMELIDGCDFLRYVRGEDAASDARSAATRTQSLRRTLPTVVTARPARAPLATPPPADVTPLADPEQWARLLPAARQLAQGVHALHEAGHLHRDIKPSNVMVTGDGRVVVLDFGVVTALEDDARATERAVVGTPAYMAPEQAGGDTLTEAADWYAVGVVLFEAITGQRPFYGDSSSLLAVKRTARAPRVEQVAPDAPAGLRELCDALLEVEPAARPSGAEVLAALGASAPASTRTSRRLSRASVIDLVGRAREVAVLREAYAAVRDGERRTVLVDGRSGIGKTALVQHVLTSLRSEDDPPPVVLEGRCYEQESVPYKAIDSLVDALAHRLRTMSDDQRRRVLPARLGALARMFPVLRAAVSDAALPAPVDPHQARRDAIDALRALLGRLGEVAPLVLWVDDAQWGDADSAALLAEVFAPPREPPALLVLGFRTGAATTSAFLRTFARWHGADATISLAPLSAGDARRLAVALLEREGLASAADADAVARESGGNPFFAAELARDVRRLRDHRDVALDGDDDPDSGDSVVRLDGMIQRRFHSLPDPARDLLSTLVVAGLPIDRAVLRAAVDLGEEENAAIALLRNTALIATRRSGRRDLVEPAHARVREAVLACLSQRTRRRAHQALARELAASGTADPEVLVTHFAGAGEPGRAADYAARAAAVASDALAFDRAAQLYRRALSLQRAAGAVDGALIAKLAGALADAGLGPEAGDTYLEAAAVAGEGDAYEMRRLAADQYLKSGQVVTGRAVLQDVLAEVGQAIPQASTTGLARFVARRVWLYVRGWRCRERPEAHLSVRALRRLDACYTGATGLGIVEGFAAADFQSRYHMYAVRAAEPQRLSLAMSLGGMLLSVTPAAGGRRWQRMIRRARERAHARGDTRALAVAASAAAMGWYHAGEFRRSLAEAERGLALYRSVSAGVAWEIWTTEVIAVWAMAALGQLVELRERVPKLVRGALDHGNLYAATNLQTGLPALRFLVADDVDGLRRARADVMRRWPSHDLFLIQHYFETVSETMWRLYAGDGIAALRYLTSRWERMAASQILRVPMTKLETHYLLACAGLAASDRGDAAGIDHARRGLRALRRHPSAFARSLAAFVRAGMAVRRDDVAGADRELVAGIALSDAAESGLYGAAARYARARLRADAGAETEARDWMTTRGVAAPERLAALLIPTP